MGGTNMKADIRALANGAGILVATPGRLNDHIDNTPGFAARLKRCNTVILDECDRYVAAAVGSA
jgi:superfamily II DNA/RNA helicase